VDQPASAGALSFLDPRAIVRLATVLQMKDRAGTVGAVGVGPLLRDLLAAGEGTARVHLVGHSYGGKVVLAALCHQPLPRPVNSLLLLQPAVSYLCFAAAVPDLGRPGGYRTALERVELPIMTTFSARDFPLTRVFHLAVRRWSDLGEGPVAAPAREPGLPRAALAPNRYAALGGYGPGGCSAGECSEIAMRAPGEHYDLGPDQPRLLALRGDDYIADHGDVGIPATWWALLNQVDQEQG
jgi:pimeloyl-ACP methyl ester carboxylesterase